ncbi:MAG: Fis family transcriptional regulator, partial [Desulfobacterales bacterium]|nr:Fis family transcriptional regulator [Desulfobacterales bacterium]
MLPDGIRSIASLIDITSVRRAQEDLREREALHHAMLDGYEGLLYFISRDFRLQFMNENLIKQVGGDAAGQICYEALHNRKTRCPWCVSDQVFNNESVRFEMKNPNDKRWYYSINTPIRHADGSISYQAMIMDIDDRKRMEQALQESEETLRKENLILRTTLKERSRFGDIVGKSEAMQEVYELMLQAAAHDANIILYGESGTGKELAARAIHDMSDRR